MFIKSHLGIAIVAAAIVHDLRTQIRAHKAAKLYLKASDAFDEQQRENLYRIEYLCQMIDNSDIEVTEFDKIVLSDPPM